MRCFPALVALAFCAPLALSFPAAQAQAPARAVPQSRSEVQLSFAPVVKRAAPAVVNVYGARVERRPRQEAMDDFFRRFFGEEFGGPFGGPGAPQRERVQRSLGSGVIVDRAGLVVTNHHVIEGMTEVRVSLTDKREFAAEIVLRDPRTDLAVLRLRGAGNALPAIEFGDSEALEVGDITLAIGNPFGVGQTVTQGIVSGLARTQVGVTDFQSFIQTDAAINPGNSGGALVDMAGRLVGINTAIFSRSGGSHGIGFAIPSGMVRAVVESARQGSATVRRPWLGATLQAVTPEIAESLGLPRPSGALVANVLPTGPAAEAGLRRGDLILALDGAAIEDMDSFGYRFALKPLGGRTQIEVLRGSRRETVALRLASPPETRPRERVTLSGRWPLAGASVVNLSPAVADELSIPPQEQGVAIVEVEPGSPAMRVGFQKGDVVIAVNGDATDTTADLARTGRERRSLWEITVSRGGQVQRIVLGG